MDAVAIAPVFGHQHASGRRSEGGQSTLYRDDGMGVGRADLFGKTRPAPHILAVAQ